jgi:hypothetical protein
MFPQARLESRRACVSPTSIHSSGGAKGVVSSNGISLARMYSNASPGWRAAVERDGPHVHATAGAITLFPALKAKQGPRVRHAQQRALPNGASHRSTAGPQHRAFGSCSAVVRHAEHSRNETKLSELNVRRAEHATNARGMKSTGRIAAGFQKFAV